MQLILHITVLLCLTAIIPESFVEADQGDYTSFVDTAWGVILGLTKEDAKKQEYMKSVREACENDTMNFVLGQSKTVQTSDLSIAEIPSKGKPPKYTKLSNLNELSDLENMLLIIPGYKTSIKTATPKYIVKLFYYLREKEKDKTIYVLDVGQHLMGNYEESALKLISIGAELGDNLAKIPKLNTIHIIGIDLGANIAAIANQIYNMKKKKPITRISALNSATICIEGKGNISKESADFVDVYRTTDFYGCDADSKEIGSIVFQIRDEKEKNSCKTFLASTEQAIDVFIDQIVGDKRKYTIKKCKDQKYAECEDMTETEFGYAIKTDPPTAENCVTVLVEPK